MPSARPLHIDTLPSYKAFNESTMSVHSKSVPVQVQPRWDLCCPGNRELKNSALACLIIITGNSNRLRRSCPTCYLYSMLLMNSFPAGNYDRGITRYSVLKSS